MAAPESDQTTHGFHCQYLHQCRVCVHYNPDISLRTDWIHYRNEGQRKMPQTNKDTIKGATKVYEVLCR